VASCFGSSAKVGLGCLGDGRTQDVPLHFPVGRTADSLDQHWGWGSEKLVREALGELGYACAQDNLPGVYSCVLVRRTGSM
jgi:hypothetical protein